MLAKIKYAIIFLMVLTLFPTQVNAGEIVETSEESVGQIAETSEESVGQIAETSEESVEQIVETSEENTGSTENLEEPKQEPEPEQEKKGEALKSDKTDLQKEDKVDLSETTGTELSYIVSSDPDAEIAGDKMKVIKNKKYVFSISIQNDSSRDLEEILVTGDIYNEEKDTVSPKFITFYPQNGVTVNDFSLEGSSTIEVSAEAEVALLKSGESITLQAEVVMPENMGDTATFTVYSELYSGDSLGYEQYELLLVNEKKEVIENPTPGKTPEKVASTEKAAPTKTAAKPTEKVTQTKTAAKTGDDSSAAVYLGVIALSALAIIVSRKKISRYN